MKIKFEKGFTPEAIAKNFLNIIYDNNILIGSLIMYVQTFDDEMKPEKWGDEGVDYRFVPSESTKDEYARQVLKHRRDMIKIVKENIDLDEIEESQLK